MKSPIAILGAGNMASALALNLARHGSDVRLYCIEPDVLEDINVRRCNEKYLVGHAFPEQITAYAEIGPVVTDARIIFVAVPSFAVKEVIEKAKPFLKKDAIIASITKGLDPKTQEPLVLTEARTLPSALRKRICSIGGPAIAGEMAKGSPTALMIASLDKKSAHTVKKLLETLSVKVAVSHDLKGVGLAAALKNPYAIALGLCDGLGYPTNAKALIVTLAIQEMKEILGRAGAKTDTASSLAGLGDLIVTGFSPLGRNRTYGERLVGAKSKDPQAFGLATVEGIAATALALKLAKKIRAKTPLLAALDRCLQARENYEQPFVSYLNRLTLN